MWYGEYHCLLLLTNLKHMFLKRLLIICFYFSNLHIGVIRYYIMFILTRRNIVVCFLFKV